MADPEDDGPGVPEWVVTYGDMMSLLLTFFIMLVSMSTIREDEGQVRAMLDSIREAFGPGIGSVGAPGKSLQTSSAFNKRNSTGNKSQGGMKADTRKTETASRGGHRAVQRINHGTVVALGGPALFGRFDSTPTESLRTTLDQLAKVVQPKPNRLMVRGHASPEPLPEDREIYAADGRRIRDQLDLSFARARAVADYLAEKGVDPRRLLVSAAGATEPRTRTRRQDRQGLNRRVDVFVVDSYITPSETAKFE
jgi:chemotaxis protein MotB